MQSERKAYQDFTPEELISHIRYRTWVRAYAAADALYDYMMERWRNEPDLYHMLCKPKCDDKFGVILEVA